MRRAGEGLREAVLREMPDPLERIDVLEIWVRHRQITAEQRAVGGAGVTIRHRAVELRRGAGAPLAALPRVDHAEGTLWFSLPGGLSATLGK